MIIPVILAGGNGTRLWPLSRSLYSKQFLNLSADNSLLQQSVLRSQSVSTDRLIIVSNEEQRFLVSEQVHALGLRADIWLEPVGRNTAPAIALAAKYAQELDAEAHILVMPADHAMNADLAFAEAISNATALSEQGMLVTFGIKPDSAETGYGYIRRAAAELGGWRVGEFVEKPDLATAQHYLQSGNYHWNSGMFLMRASSYLEELNRWQPAIAKAIDHAFKTHSTDMDFHRIDAEAFAACPSESIDYAVMEKTDRACMVELRSSWSDIGSFAALWAHQDKDNNHNAIHGDVIAIDTQGSLLHAENRLLATLGVENIVVVETKDAVLVAHKDQVQNVKSIVAELKAQARSESELHREVHRPWGKYDSIDQSDGYLVKRITVNPKQKLSLQYHHHRAEHWVVVRGTATVHLDGEVKTLTANQSIYIPKTSIHSLENRSDELLEIIEVQTGEILVEDDIVRVEDRYGR